jgi:hypothetical protein
MSTQPKKTKEEKFQDAFNSLKWAISLNKIEQKGQIPIDEYELQDLEWGIINLQNENKRLRELLEQKKDAEHDK